MLKSFLSIILTLLSLSAFATDGMTPFEQKFYNEGRIGKVTFHVDVTLTNLEIEMAMVQKLEAQIYHSDENGEFLMLAPPEKTFVRAAFVNVANGDQELVGVLLESKVLGEGYHPNWQGNKLAELKCNTYLKISDGEWVADEGYDHANCDFLN